MPFPVSLLADGVIHIRHLPALKRKVTNRNRLTEIALNKGITTSLERCKKDVTAPRLRFFFFCIVLQRFRRAATQITVCKGIYQLSKSICCKIFRLCEKITLVVYGKPYLDIINIDEGVIINKKLAHCIKLFMLEVTGKTMNLITSRRTKSNTKCELFFVNLSSK